MWQMYVFHPTMTNPRSNNVFLKIVRFSVCHAQLALAFFAKYCSCVGVFCSPGTNCVCACKKDVRSKWLKPHFGTNSPKLAKLKHMKRNDKLWKNEEMKNYGNMMKQYYLNETTETIWTKNNRQREWNHSLCYCVSCVSRGSQPLGSHSEDCTM